MDRRGAVGGEPRPNLRTHRFRARFLGLVGIRPVLVQVQRFLRPGGRARNRLEWPGPQHFVGHCQPAALRKGSALPAVGPDPTAIFAAVSRTMKLKILLTGANGQVGWELKHYLTRLGDVIPLDRRQLDLTNFTAIRRKFRESRPHLIVNAAAYTAVEQAESDCRMAQAV